MQIPENFTELSIRMTEALADSGAGNDTVMERRKVYLWRERMETLLHGINGKRVECFHFGSQSEGTTTPGLHSDIDVLLSYKFANIMRDWGDWEAGMWNLLMLHDDLTPPQQYLLQAIDNGSPEPESRLSDIFVRNDHGQVLLSAEQFKKRLKDLARERAEATQNGPSVSYIPNWDMVCAFHVRKPLPEIQHWINRCRGRNWPSAQLLNAARVTSCFLVPAGHPDSEYKREEWRLSPNLIERMLMFSFNMIQIKCYIFLKLMKKTLFTQIVGDSITSYHCKTIMFYTIERTHPCLWVEHNLMFLLWRCLQVLRKSLRMGRLPHYIIEGVNLFDGKLSRVQQRRLLVYVDSMIRNNLQDVFYIDIDEIGCRLQARSVRRIGQAGELGRICLSNSISLLLKFDCLASLYMSLRGLLNKKPSSNTTFEKEIQCLLRNAFEYCTNVRLKNVALELIKHLYSLHISIQASKCLRLQNAVESDIIRRFQYSLNLDVASSRLKLASLLYCSGHIHAAVRVLEDVERRYYRKVKAVCGCRYMKGERDRRVLGNTLSGNCVKGCSELTFALCVKFFRQESHCIPFILLFEMNRNITEEEVAQRDFVDKQWMDSAEVDALPFLYYLQYLTYGRLGERNKQIHAWRTLESYLCDARTSINRHHNETALNLVGHIFEMEGYYYCALYYYRESLSVYDTNNAANLHVQRVLRLISG
ncbi:uncharacterized protein LOC127862152 [Dreissena polymorpha]|uniref:uncharacterized protein LOC127862152 n=1 Tax=Dreissena polymorpha TaxID=45954 RepID=UPI0022654741|nr:uncharacterized protein LOC127862152 [Dreissena polymorpha]